MKKILFVTLLTMTSFLSAAQTYCFAYSTGKKTITVSNVIAVPDGEFYQANRTLENLFVDALKVEYGSDFSDYKGYPIFTQYKQGSYGKVFTSIQEANAEIKKIIAEYKGKGYALVRVNL